MPGIAPSSALLDRVKHHAATRGDALAYTLAGGGRTMTWSELSSNVDHLAAQITAAVPAGSAVILCAANELEFPAAFLAILAAECEAFCIACDTPMPALRHAAEQANARAIIGHAEAVRTLADRGPGWVLPPLPPGESWGEGRLGRAALTEEGVRDADERFKTVTEKIASPVLAGPHPNPLPEGEGTKRGAALLLQSSGTTGTPKIVRRSGRSLDAVSAAMADAVGFTADDHVLAAVPLTHSYGIEHGLLAPVWAGSTVHLCRGLDLPAIAAELDRGRITVLPGVPAMFEALADLADALSVGKIRVAYSAGAPLPESVVERFAARFGTTVTQLYGATEIGSVTFNALADEPFDRASVGKPMRGVEIRVLEQDAATGDGHIAIRADSMFDGYLHDDADLIDGYFPTGDLGRVDDRGRLFITGRLKLLIDVGGRKVNPLEVEAVLREDPRVGDCVVVPLPLSATLNRLRAIVTPRDAALPPDVSSLRALARERLAGYKVPRVIEVRASLPRTSAGKILRQAIE